MKAGNFCKWLGWFSLMTTGALAQGLADEAPQVPVARAVIRKVSDFEVFSGRLEAASRVELRCRVSGYLLKASFLEGSDVKQGDVLFEIDPRPYRAEMDRAEAALGLADARLKLADANHKRAAPLRARGAISQEEFDKIVAERAQAEAATRVAMAGRDAARLNLDYTRVVAPIAGRIGRRLLDPGNVVKADETRLAVIVSREPMHVSFDIDERSLLRLMRLMRDSGKVEKVTVDIALSDDNGFPQRGVIDFIDNQVDPATGSVKLRAVVANRDGRLSPGTFARIRLALGPPHEAVLVPSRAIRVEDGEPFVFVVNDKSVLETRPVKLGQLYDGLRALTGLKANEQAVIGGFGKLRPGMTVKPRLEALPEKKHTDVPEDAGSSGAPLARGPFGPGILVDAVYPGASASVVSDSVRGPVEQMIGGLERLRYMRSRCTSDGKLAIALAFNRGVDLQRLQGLTQNRVSQALSLLPDAVKRNGISVTQGLSRALLIISLSSPDGGYDALYLGNYANIQLKDELVRVAGVGEVRLIGRGDYALRVWLDPAKLAERRLNADEVSRLLAKEKDRGADQEKLANLILKADGDGRTIRLRDVARIELGAGQSHSEAILDGKRSVVLVVYPIAEASAQETRAALRKRLTELRARLPDGLALEEAFGFTPNAECMLLDLDVPIGAAAEPMEKVLRRCEELLRPLPGIDRVLALSENPFDLFGSGPCVLVRLSPAEKRIAREKFLDSIRARLAALENATVRIRDLSQPGRVPDYGYPVNLALAGSEAARVRDWANELGDRLARGKKLSDVWVSRDGAPRTQRFVEIDREAAAARGVSLSAIMNALEVLKGPQQLGGRNWRMEVRADIGSGDWARGLRQLKIRNSAGQMIPLNVVLALREETQPLALHFLDGRSMVEITANPALGVPIEHARKICEAAAEAARHDLSLGGDYRLTWLQDRPGSH